MQSLKDKTGCGAFFCVAGPDLDGDTFVWMYVEYVLVE